MANGTRAGRGSGSPGRRTAPSRSAGSRRATRHPGWCRQYLLKSSGLVDALGALFELVWDLATPFHLAVAPGRSTPDARQPGPDESRVLTLLVSGVPDDAICRQLGISHRTLQRRISRLQTRVGARTRFQLAHRATHRNWI